MASINLASIQNLLRPGLAGVTGMYDQIPTQWSQVFDTENSEMNSEITAEERYLGLARLKNEGAQIEFDNAAGDRFRWTVQHTVFGLGYAVTKEAIEDNLYKKQFNTSNLGLVNSFKQTKEIVAANVLNNGTVYNASIGGDGVALFSTAHPVDGATWANRPAVDVDLNEAALENALTTIRYFPDQANLRVLAKGQKLIVPPQLEYVANRILETDLRVGTSDNDINAIKYLGKLPGGVVVMDFLTSPFAWFVKSDIKGLVNYNRRAFSTDMQADFTTGNLMVTGDERYSFAAINPRSVYGSFATS